MVTELVNLASTERLDKGTVLRVTLSRAYALLNPSWFGKKVNEFYANLAPSKIVYPISPNPAVADATVAVVSVRVAEKLVPAAEVLNVFNTHAGFYLSVTRVEKLAPEKAKTEAGNLGAVEREKVKQQQQQAESWDKKLGLDKLAATFGTTVTVVKYTALAVVILGVLVLVLFVRNQVRSLTT
jgi:hypothetical protein